MPEGTFRTRATSSPTFGDVDGDGDPDLLVGKTDGYFDYYRYGDADGNPVAATRDDGDSIPDYSGWSEPPTAENPFSAFRITDIKGDNTNNAAFGDVDGDGDIDVLVGEDAEFTLIRRGTATDGDAADSGKGWSVQSVATSQSGDENTFAALNGVVRHPAFGDVDGDGDDDLLFGVSNSAGLEFYRWGLLDDGISTGWSERQSGTDNPLSGVNVGNGAAPAFGDVDGDGDIDLLLGKANGELHFIRRGTANDGTAADSTKSWSRQTGTDNPFNGVDVGGAADPTFGDVDGDGDMDLVVGENFGNLNVWYWNDDMDIWQTTSDL